MTSKTTLSLIEQVIMVLIFSIATAICLNIFVYSNNLSKSNELKDEAVSAAVNAAEILKNTHGDISKAEASSNSDNFSLTVKPVDSGSKFLGKAKIYVLNDGDTIYTLEVSWQEVV